VTNRKSEIANLKSQIENLPEVAVSGVNHPNPYMFAGARYDIEIGLSYSRAGSCW